ncbi:restriction endonuclease subunit S [Mesonia sp.]|uniref:restriction endonuclease subunit S n=1 Tax=Mesonia sp. TaxID=1960830 RepID=UPI001756BCBC|nr:restriction endonuclease subunit S [Mesonia sp.]HIB36983.1 restriction endonuclease subunit S [Mesonia sp.]
MSDTILRESDKIETKQGYKKTKLGWIPEDWEVIELGKIGETITGLTYNPKMVSVNGVLVLRSSNVQDRQLKFDDNVFVDVDESNFNETEEGDIIICVRNGSRSLIGKNAIIDSANAGTAFGAFMLIFRSKEYRFLYQLFDTHYYVREIHRNLGATINSINTNNLKRFRFPFPPKDERKKIAKCLSTWDDALVKIDQLITAKQKLKKALMQQLLSGKKRLPGFMGEWEEKRLDYFFCERSERNNEELLLLSIGEAGVYPQDDSNKKDTSNKDKSKYKKICVGDIGYNTMRMWQGRSALSNLEGIVSPAYTIVRPKKNTDSRFFAYLFKTPSIIHRFYRNSQGMVSDTLNCKFKDFAPIKLVLPTSREEQTAIAEVLNTAASEIELLKTQREQLQAQKKGLMQQLLTGKKRLKC